MIFTTMSDGPVIVTVTGLSSGAGAGVPVAHSARNCSAVPLYEFVSVGSAHPGQPCGPGPCAPSEYCQSQNVSQDACVVGFEPYCASHSRRVPKNVSTLPPSASFA